MICILLLSVIIQSDISDCLSRDSDLMFFLEADIDYYLSMEQTGRSTQTLIDRQTDYKPQLKLYALSAALMDSSNGRILYSRSSDDKLAMASTTKIMTCIYALQNSDPDEVVTFSKYAASMPDVQLNAREGEQFYLGDLLYSLMLESHNDTAVAIAEHVSGSVEDFCSGMTSLAHKIGAGNTSFMTPNGLDSDGHYTTAADLCLIGSYALQDEDFIRITNTPSHTFSNIEGTRSYSVSNKDSFLNMMEGAIGIKTGFTGKAGYCFVGALKSADTIFVSSVLASGWPPHKSYKWSDTKTLMNYALENFKLCDIYAGNASNASFVPVLNGAKRNSGLIYPDNAPELSLLLAGWEEVTVEYALPNYLCAPVDPKCPVGNVTYKIDGVPYKTYNIFPSDTVECIDYRLILEKIIAFIL